MKIGIFTFHSAGNYGAVLQAYGLQEFLRSLGHDAWIVDYAPQYISREYRVFARTAGLSASKNFLRSCLIALTRWRRNRLFRRFRQDHLRLARIDLAELHNDFDAFVFGSDQIWSPVITEGGDPVYFGLFPAARGKRLVAYAASMGSVLRMSGPLSALFKKGLARFSALSVREKPLADCLAHDFKLHASLACDPVFLAGREVFDRIATRPAVSRPYLLLFLLNGNEVATIYGYKLARRLGLSVVNVGTYETVHRSNVKTLVDLEHFLGYIKQASFVVTNSFHAMAFSLLYERDFVVVSRDERMDERVLSLLRQIGLAQRLVDAGKCIITDESPIDYHNVNFRLNKMQCESRRFILESLREK